MLSLFAQGVSILILLELPFDYILYIKYINISRVSILILLELPFDRREAPVLHTALRFQSLFYWNCRLILNAIHSDRVISEFQSLFYWNCRLIPIPFSASRLRLMSFNPYFIGIAV